MNYDSISMWVAIASFVVSVTALFIAWSSLSQAKQVADRDRRDWRQRKWFDLYVKASAFYDSLDHFQTLYNAATFSTATKDWNNLMFLLREAHTMAVVFPKNAATDEFILCTAVFKDHAEVLSQSRWEKVLNALEGIRQRALVDPTILG